MKDSRTHVKEKFVVRHTHPAKSKARAVIDFHVKHSEDKEKIMEYNINKWSWDGKHYPLMAHLVENKMTSPLYLEKHRLSLDDAPYGGYFPYITPEAIAIGMTNAYVNKNREITDDETFNIESPLSENSFGQSMENVELLNEIAGKFIDALPKIQGEANERADGRGKLVCESKSPCICDRRTQVLKVTGSGWRIPRCVQDMVDLEELDMDGASARRIDNLDGLTKLEKLDLRNNVITKLENLDELENLNILSVRSDRYGKNNVKKVENLEPLQQLSILDLSNNGLMRSDSLDGMIPLKNLRRVVIGKTDIARNKDVLKRVKNQMARPDFKFLGRA